MRRLFLFCFFVATHGWSPATGAEPQLSPEYAACMDESAGVTVAMLNCIGAETDRQDRRLNANYRQLMQELAPSRKQALREAQRTWIRFRDLDCAFLATPEGGTAANLRGADCVLRMTAERADHLVMLGEMEAL